jgi:hypothetical protein
MENIIIVDHITKLSYKEVDPRIMEDFTIKIINVRKLRSKIERRKNKIKMIYE